MNISGLYTAMITPFKNDEFDEAGFRENLRFQVASGVDGVVVLGSTGEVASLTDQEREQIVKIAIEEASQSIQVIVGTGTNSTRSTIDYTQKAKELGADAALIVTPYYTKPTQRGIYQHFEAISRTVDIPIILYNNPSRTGINVEPLTLREIAMLPNVVAVKEASGDIHQVSDYLHHNSIAVLSGDDSMALPLMALGGHGLISIASNLVPIPMRAVIDGDREMHFRLFPLFKGLNFETNPIPIKEAMNRCGLPAGNCRLPLHEMTEPHRAALHQLLQELELCTIPI